MSTQCNGSVVDAGSTEIMFILLGVVWLVVVEVAVQIFGGGKYSSLCFESEFHRSRAVKLHEIVKI